MSFKHEPATWSSGLQNIIWTGVLTERNMDTLYEKCMLWTHYS